MNPKNQIIFLVSLFSILILLPFSLAEIVIQTTGTASGLSNVENSTSGSLDTHTFVVNRYYPSTPTQPQQQTIQTSLMIQQIVSEAQIIQCNEANFSFKITNPSSLSEIYSFSIKDFSGTGYITPNLQLASKETKIVYYKLVPDCSLTGTINPRIYVETQNSNEEAEIPVILKIDPGNFIGQSECSYYYNTTICESNYYVKFNEDTTYKIDLSKWFYDPDGDKLIYSAKEGVNLNINIKGSIAYLKPTRDWFGKEEIVFYATDEKGGEAISRKFFVHVVDTEEKGFFAKLFSSLFG